MVSKYDVFYVIATKGEIRVIDIVDALHKNKEEYRSIFNQVLKLEKENLVYRNEAVRPSKDPSSVQLFQLIRFCVDNGMNYNLMLKPTMIEFIEQAARKEFFTTKDITIIIITMITTRHPNSVFLDSLNSSSLFAFNFSVSTDSYKKR